MGRAEEHAREPGDHERRSRIQCTNGDVGGKPCVEDQLAADPRRK